MRMSRQVPIKREDAAEEKEKYSYSLGGTLADSRPDEDTFSDATGQTSTAPSMKMWPPSACPKELIHSVTTFQCDYCQQSFNDYQAVRALSPYSFGQCSCLIVCLSVCVQACLHETDSHTYQCECCGLRFDTFNQAEMHEVVCMEVPPPDADTSYDVLSMSSHPTHR